MSNTVIDFDFVKWLLDKPRRRQERRQDVVLVEELQAYHAKVRGESMLLCCTDNGGRLGTVP
jgi:hypothetical protein